MRVLTVDVGNTMADFALYREDRMHFYMTVESEKLKEDDTYELLPAYDVAVLLSVVPSLNEVVEERLKQAGEVVRFNVESVEGLKSEYNLEEIGEDRIANIYAFLHKYGRSGIIVDFGTAITIDVLKGGVHRGGIIMPGFKTSLECLNEKTEKINIVDFATPSLIGRGTRDAVSAGILRGLNGAVLYLIRAIKKEFKIKAKVVFTGGGLNFVEKELFKGIVVAPYLTLEGLYLFFKNQTKKGV